MLKVYNLGTPMYDSYAPNEVMHLGLEKAKCPTLLEEFASTEQFVVE